MLGIKRAIVCGLPNRQGKMLEYYIRPQRVKVLITLMNKFVLLLCIDTNFL